MISVHPLIALLDANVLFAASVRDYLLNLAELNVYTPKWTDEIQEEWIKSLLAKRKDLSRKSLDSAKNSMNSAFPDANIISYKVLIPSLILPDKKDRHVLAAAIKASASVIVTFNIKDFPSSYLKTHGIGLQHPDDFILRRLHDNPTVAYQALKNQVARLKNPPLSMEKVLQVLHNVGLTKSVSFFKKWGALL